MKNKILIGVVTVVGAFGLVSTCSRESPDHGPVAVDDQGLGSEPSAIVRETEVETRSKQRPLWVPVTGDNAARLRSRISEVLGSSRPRNEKMEHVRELLAELSGLEGCARTIAWLKDSVGEGTDFSLLVSGIFLGSKEPLEILYKEIENLPTATRSGVCAVLFQKMIESDEPADQIRTAFSFGESDSLDEGIGIALQLIFMQSESINESKNSMRTILKKLEGSDLEKFRDAYLNGLARVSPKDAWNEMQMLGEGSPDSDTWQPGVRERLSAQLRALGAKESLEFLIQEGGSASDVAKSVSMWGNMNSVELNKWVSDQMKNLPASQQDGVRSGLANLLLEKRDFPAVTVQLDGITDQKVRSEIERRLWEVQRDAIKQDVSKDAAGTVQSIISGQSQYSDYWLEEAMGTWVARDFEKANDWYQQNWNNMSAVKSQYVAAAFANQAVEQGDLATARQWAALIHDSKTKQRIDAGIAKAEGQNGD